MSQEVVDDWEQREFIASMEDALVKIVDFLNRFGNSITFLFSFWQAEEDGAHQSGLF